MSGFFEKLSNLAKSAVQYFAEQEADNKSLSDKERESFIKDKLEELSKDKNEVESYTKIYMEEVKNAASNNLFIKK
jgi:hypothetical protein